MPLEFHHSNKSAHTLLKESRYFETFENITEKEIGNALRSRPENINHWLQWSADQRTPEGWVFANGDNLEFTVTYFPFSEDNEQFTTLDAITGCSVCVNRVIEHMRTLQ